MIDEQLEHLVDTMLSLDKTLRRLATAIETIATNPNVLTRNTAETSIKAEGISSKSPIKVIAPKRRAATKTTLTSRSK